MQSHMVVMQSKYEGKCTKCKYPIWKGAWMIWNRNKNTARHKKCPFTREQSNGRVRHVTGAQ